MTYQQHTTVDLEKDIILPCRKGATPELSGVDIPERLDFEAELGNFHTLYGTSGNKVYLLGLGDANDSANIGEAFQKICYKRSAKWTNEIQVIAAGLTSEEIKKATIGLEMGTYEIGQLKTKQKDAKETLVTFVTSNDVSAELQEGKFTGDTVNRIKALVDAPANVKTPEYLGNWASESSHSAGYKCTVFGMDELEKQGFDAVIAVGKGSVNTPVVIVNEYMARPGDKIDIGLVGKGITFDTGGVSIKPSQNLHYMKSDMGGAAAVLGAVELVARLQLDVNVVGVVASAENAVDMNSYRPGDVINSYSGKTIEIIDTDAEGRLVMADAISYLLKKYSPERMIDLATLTGSVVRTLGNAAAGMFTNNAEMAQDLSRLGAQVHERVWQLPLYADFESDLHSDIADIRNFSGKPVGGAINAAKFLEAFTESHEAWTHLDIAGVAFGDSGFAKMKSATGYGVQLLLAYIRTLN
ncbi:MAG: leucyl aminopeptidase family protein [Bacteroidota bacterium]